MIKNCLFAVALLSLALAGGCAKGGNGTGSGITVTVNDNHIPAIYPNQSVTFTATVTGTTNTAVTWSLRGTGSECTGTGNPCGTIDKNSGVYVAPAAPPSPATVTITATSVADNTATGSTSPHIVLITVVVSPTAVTVGQNLVQKFTAVAIPDDAPQTFTWSCTPTGNCGSFAPNPNNAAVYTAPPSPFTGSVVVAATSTVQQSPAGVGQAKVTVATSRLPSGTYAFRFSGYDNSNNPVNPVAVAGSLTAGANGIITGGVEDVLPAPPGGNPLTITSGSSYAPSSNNDNSNNLGTLTLNLSNGTTNITNIYTAVLTSSGIIRMIESPSDGTGITGSGVMQKSAAGTVFNAGAQTFVFGFTGVDSTGNRVGYVGLLPLTPSGTGGTITGGLLDVNDNGSNACGSTPCPVTGTYQTDGTIPGLWHMTLNSVTTLDFDFFVSGGQTNAQPNPLTLYAISTDDPTSHPALSGSMVYQWPGTAQAPMTYNNAAFNGTSVSNLTGASANVSLTLGTTHGDGTFGYEASSASGSGQFDQNNDGVILSVPSTSPFSYTYVASTTSNGRYTFNMLGNPTTTPPTPPLPFVLYASGANRGFLLDQSTSVPATVMTGTMDPQPAKESGNYTPSELPGTFAAATTRNSDSSVVPVVENLLLTSPGGGVYDVAGTLNPGNQTLTGTYTMTLPGTGTITLTAPTLPAVPTSAIYAIDFDSTNSVITDFMMMGTTSGTPSSIIFAQQ